MSDTTEMVNLPIAAIDDTSGARMNDTRHRLFSRVGRSGNASMCLVSCGAAVNLGTSMNEDLAFESGRRRIRVLCVPLIRVPP